jgi:hypothetical protein
VLDVLEPERRVARAKDDKIRVNAVREFQYSFGCVAVFNHGLWTAPLVGLLGNHFLQCGFEWGIEGLAFLGCGHGICDVTEVNACAAVLGE